MSNKKSNKISIKPMNNAAAIASTLGISASVEPEVETPKRKIRNKIADSEVQQQIPQSNAKPQTAFSDGENNSQTASEKLIAVQKGIEAVMPSKTAAEANQVTRGASESSTSPEMPLLIDIKRKFPGKELFILSLLYLQKNQRGLVQMTVGSMMALYSAVFQDVIKDDTVRRSLKRLFDAGFIKTTSIPGNNSGYIYEIGELLESENLSAAEKEEFAELTEFVESRLNGIPA